MNGNVDAPRTNAPMVETTLSAVKPSEGR